MTFSLSFFLGAIIVHIVALVLLKIYLKPLAEWVSKKSPRSFLCILGAVTVASVAPWIALLVFVGWKTTAAAFLCCWVVEFANNKWLSKKSGFSKEEVYVTL